MQSIRHQVISVFRMLEKDKSYDIFKEYFSSVLDMLTALHGDVPIIVEKGGAALLALSR